MSNNFIKINYWLYPFSLLYGIGVGLRNLLFNWGILSAKTFNIPIICVGNITVGGTGKTPHVEYLIRLLHREFNVGILSRGYKRESIGFQLATSNSKVKDVGDEPYQMKINFPEVTIAVDKNRRHGIKELMNEKICPPLDIIILDDAFQHRYVKAGLNIVLIDYNRFITDDLLLPAGRLRESAKEIRRAQIIIVTKCPSEIKPMDIRILSKKLNISNYQSIFFSSIKYNQLIPVFRNNEKSIEFSDLKNQQILLVTGIASPKSLLEYLKGYSKEITSLHFSDHHSFKKNDIKTIKDNFKNIKNDRKIIITTHKDAVRLQESDYIEEELKVFFYYLPIEIVFLQNQQESFNQNILSYVRKNKRNSLFYKRENAQ